MQTGKLQIVIQSIRFYRKPVIYQVLIIALLAAVITGSLLTGNSVKLSLKKTATQRLGNTGFLISSGLRYFDASMPGRLKSITGVNSAGVLEINGYCQSLNSQKRALNTHIYGVTNEFFTFNGNNSIKIAPGEVAVNKRLADYLSLKQGDNLIVYFKKISAIPADAPFASSAEEGESVVLRIGSVLTPESSGNFSLSISQIMPLNIFVNSADLFQGQSQPVKINRLLFDQRVTYSSEELSLALKKILLPSDIGLAIRMIKKTGQPEIISDRIFIDGAALKLIKDCLPGSAPVITYLGNRFQAASGSTPYSFVSALPSSVYPGIVSGNEMIINKWMAADLNVKEGDSVRMFWYSPDQLNKLVERNSGFVVKKIVNMQGIWSDSLLMPAFPGISGRESCSDWDAGIPVKMNQIRPKDEEYWNKFRGTPKAFISYEKGSELWGSNYGPATSVRFPEGKSIEEILNELKGSLDPQLTGFTISDIYSESVKAADEGVDFGTLFLSLGFFLIVASIVLLSFAISSYFDSRKEQIRTFFALGFNTRWIEKLLFLETSLIAVIGCLTGGIAGYFVNILITKALNSVWQGAVQTDTLSSFLTFIPVLEGILITLFTSLIILLVKVKRYLISLNRKEKEIYKRHSQRSNLLFFLLSMIITLILYILSVSYGKYEMALGFTSGTALLLTLILAWRQYFIHPVSAVSGNNKSIINLSRNYYLFNPALAVTPILFIAAGLFAVFIIGANRMNFNEKLISRSSGTGGYLLWCETSIPLIEDLNSLAGKKSLGLDADTLSDMTFIQMKRSSGNDASCLNLNHIVSPPLLGVDPADFIDKGSFSFSRGHDKMQLKNGWNNLNLPASNNCIYGIADQTVIDWGLKIRNGDTLTLRAENGQPLNIIMAGGLKSSVFQGFVLIGKENFNRYFPSVPGSSVLLVDGKPGRTDLYKNTLEERLESYGPDIEKTPARLSSFNEVTNTYLSVFGAFGALGMITGIGGLGFVLLRNYNKRKREFGLLMATGFSVKKIRHIILSDQVLILFAGVSTGLVSAIVATLPSVKGNPDIPWHYLAIMVLAIVVTGLFVLFLSINSVSSGSLKASLKKD